MRAMQITKKLEKIKRLIHRSDFLAAAENETVWQQRGCGLHTHARRNTKIHTTDTKTLKNNKSVEAAQLISIEFVDYFASLRTWHLGSLSTSFDVSSLCCCVQFMLKLIREFQLFQEDSQDNLFSESMADLKKVVVNLLLDGLFWSCWELRFSLSFRASIITRLWAEERAQFPSNCPQDGPSEGCNLFNPRWEYLSESNTGNRCGKRDWWHSANSLEICESGARSCGNKAFQWTKFSRIREFLCVKQHS